jgi:tetratricopeptide (TPR) repeat protein
MLALVGLSSCAALQRLQLPQLPQPSQSQAAPPLAVAPAAPAPPGTAKELFRSSLDALQHGDGETARPLLRQVLVLEPNHKYAPTLLAQIDADPVQMLGKENFPYKVQSGDTLSLISKRFLGDPFKFYILARYNGMVTSDYLEAGRTLKIPGKKPPPDKAMVPQQVEYAEQPPAVETSSLRLSEAKALYKNERYPEAEKVLENLRLEASSAEADELLAAAYSSHGKILTDSGRFEQARKLLLHALNTFPSNQRLKEQLSHIETYQSAEQTYKEGNQLLNEGQLQNAYAAYSRTLKLEPDHPGARAALVKIKPEVVEAYYADSIRARRRQNFTDALEKLDQLLEIDPNHQLAKASRMEIKAILEREQAMQAR